MLFLDGVVVVFVVEKRGVASDELSRGGVGDSYRMRATLRMPRDTCTNGLKLGGTANERGGA
jgi:hypothetical protein